MRERATALAEAVSLAAIPQLRNMATLGGNLLQRPRCWYFFDPLISCWLKGGTDCPAREGENQLHAVFPAEACLAVHPPDPATALVALDASVYVLGARGERTVPIQACFTTPNDSRTFETALADDQLILAVTVLAASGARSAYLQAMDRTVSAFALLAVAACLRVERGRIAEGAPGARRRPHYAAPGARGGACPHWGAAVPRDVHPRCRSDDRGRPAVGAQRLQAPARAPGARCRAWGRWAQSPRA